MAELIVRTAYMTTPRQFALRTLKVLFPLWGVCAPLTAAFLAMNSYFTFIQQGHLSSTTIASACSIAGLLLIFLLGLAAVHWLSHDSVVIDKDGVRLPRNFFGSVPNLPWSMIRKVTVCDPEQTNWKKRNVVFSTAKRSYRLSLSCLEDRELEQLLLATDMWKGEAEVDGTVRDLMNEVGGHGAANQLSFTDMWEDELGRRFCPTAFVPLEPDRVMRSGSLKVVRHLALGGLSAVYLCQLDERKMVVLKEAVVSDDSTESSQLKAREMLAREAEMLLKLSNPNIVKVLDYFTEQGRNYLMLEYVNGQDLRQLVKQNGPQREAVVIGWALQMAGILKYLHEQDPPVIHRDFTSDNLVLCQDGSIILIDFGAANEFISNATGTFVGKHAFIAPEQFRGRAVVQSDIYAFGCTLHYLLTGQEPEALSTSSPKELNPRVSNEMNELVKCCTQLEPGERYQSAAQLVPILRGLAAALPMLN